MPNCHASPEIYADMALLPIGTKIAIVNNNVKRYRGFEALNPNFLCQMQGGIH